MKLTDGEGIAEVGNHEALAYGGGFQCNRSQYFERMGKTSYGSKAGCVDEIINRVGTRRTQGDCHTTQGDSHTTQGDCHAQLGSRTQGDCHTMHDLGIVLANLRLGDVSDGETHQPHSTVEQLEENQQQQNGEVSKDVIITVIEEDAAVDDGLVRLDPPSCDDDEEDGDEEGSDEESETHLLERSPMYGIPARCSTAAWPGVVPGVSETYPDIGCHVAEQRPDMPAHKRGMDYVCQEPIKYFRPHDAGQCSLGGMSGHGVLDEVSSASGSCVKMFRQTSMTQKSGGTLYTSEITQPCPGQILCDNPELNMANWCLDVFSPQPSISAGRNLNSFQPQPGSQVGRDSKKQVNEYQHASLDLQQRSSQPSIGHFNQTLQQRSSQPSIGHFNQTLKSHPSKIGQQTGPSGPSGPPAALCGPPTTLCGPPTALCGPPATLCGPPATLFGSPTGLPLSPPLTSRPSSNRSARSLDSGVCSPLSDNSFGCPLQINTVVSSDQDGDCASDDSCIGENITSSSTELNLILEFIQQEMSEEQNQQSQISPPRASNVLLGSRFSSVTSSENMAQHNCPHPRTGIDCSQPRCASHNGLQPASHNGLQHVSHNGLQHVSYNGLQHASHNGLQHASHNGLQHASHNGLQPASHNGLQHVSHNGLQHVSYNGLQHASHNGLQHASHNGLQHASHNGLQHASQNGLQPASHNGLQHASHNGLQHASHNGLQPASHNGICPLDEVPKSSVRGAPEQSLTAITCSSLPVASRQGRTTMAATQGGAVMVPLKLVVITQQAPPPKYSPTHYRPICPRTEKADNPPEQAASSRSQVDHTDPTTSILPAREEQKQHTYSDKKKLQQARRSVADAPIDDLRSVDDDGENCVHVAVCQTDHPMVRALVERLVRENIADMINAQNLQGQTPLYLATSTNNTKTVTVLVEYGADANLLAESMTSCGNCQKLGAIHCASTKGQKYLYTLKALLAAPGINLDLVNSEGHTALHCAVLSHGKMGMDNIPVNSVSIIQALIHAGADPNIQVQQNGKTALMFALESRDIHLIEKTFQLVEPAKLYTFLKTQAFDGSTCMKIARSLKPSLDPAGQKRLSNCLKPTARRVSS